MLEDTADEVSYDDDPYVPPTVPEIIAKGLMGILGIVAVLGTVRWLESDNESGYRVSSAAIGMLGIVIVVWDGVTGRLRDKRAWSVFWLVIAIGSLSGAFIGPP